MPSNGSVPPVRPPAPKGPPTITHRDGSPPIPPPMRNPNGIPARPTIRYNDEMSKRNALIGVLLLGTFLVLIALGYAKTMSDLDNWVKNYNLRHCKGDFDTPQCRKDRADARAKAYINAKGAM